MRKWLTISAFFILGTLRLQAQFGVYGGIVRFTDGSNVITAGDNANNALRVNCITGCTAGGSFADNSAFTIGTTSIVNIGGVFNDGAAAIASGNAAAARITSKRAIHVNLRDNSGNEVGISGAPLFTNLAAVGGTTVSGANVVDVANTAFRVNCVTGCGASSFADNSVFTAGTTAITNIGGVFNDGLAAVTSGNAAAPRITNNRGLHSNLRNNAGTEIASATAAPGGSELGLIVRNIPSGTQTTDPSDRAARLVGVVYGSQAQQLKQTATNFNLQVELATGGTLYDARSIRALTSADVVTVVGNVASGVADSNNPVKIGGVFNTTQPTVTTGQRVDTQHTARGALIVAAGVEALNVTVNAALPTGANTIGAVTQASGPWTVNLTQVSSGAVATVATGTQKVGIADSAGAAFLSAANALNSTGTGLLASQIVAQFDDTAPTAITENQFGNLRMSANRNLYGTIRDAAGNERGANVNASNQLATISSSDGATAAAVPANASFIGMRNGSSNLIGAIRCNLRANFDQAFTAAQSVQLVAGVASQKIFICSASFVAAGASSVKFTEGTGTNCGTGKATVAGAYAVAANGGVVLPFGLNPLETTTAADALCVESSAAVTVAGVVQYAQFVP